MKKNAARFNLHHLREGDKRAIQFLIEEKKNGRANARTEGVDWTLVRLWREALQTMESVVHVLEYSTKSILAECKVARHTALGRIQDILRRISQYIKVSTVMRFA